MSDGKQHQNIDSEEVAKRRGEKAARTGPYGKQDIVEKEKDDRQAHFQENSETPKVRDDGKGEEGESEETSVKEPQALPVEASSLNVDEDVKETRPAVQSEQNKAQSHHDQRNPKDVEALASRKDGYPSAKEEGSGEETAKERTPSAALSDDAHSGLTEPALPSIRKSELSTKSGPPEVSKTVRDGQKARKRTGALSPASRLDMEAFVLPPLPENASARERARWQRKRKILLRHISRKHMRDERNRAANRLRKAALTLVSTLLAIVVIFTALSGTGAFLGYRFYMSTEEKYQGTVTTLFDLVPKDNLKMYDRNNTLIGQLQDQGFHTYVKFDGISKDLINATVAIEDKDFWENPGVDVLRIVQAALQNLRSGRVVQGGSTITQQLIKKLIVGDKVSPFRKLEEIVLTPQVNSNYSKRDIMELYLNTIYYGNMAYGIDAAAYIYFGLEDKPGLPASKQLSLAQAAMLAGLPQGGDLLNPRYHPESAMKRMELVLNSMVSQGYITKVQALEAEKEAQKPDFVKWPKNGLKNLAPHFFYYVLRELQQKYKLKPEELSLSGLNVYTTLDLKLQEKVQKAMLAHTDDLKQYGISNAAAVLIEPKTGAIRTLLGSLDYNNEAIGGQFDVATMGMRQPGSSFKPYVYATALEKFNASPGQAVADVETTFDLPSGPFEPGNYDEKFHGHMTIRCALQNSLNIPAVRTLDHLGVDEAMKKVDAMGIQHEGYPGLSMVLGGLEVNMLDHVSAFGTFANQGVHVPHYVIEKVVHSGSGKVEQHAREKGQRIFSPQIAYMITNVLSDNKARIPQMLDCNVLELYSNSQQECLAGDRGVVRPAAAKTGTTNNFKDNWTLGYTTDYVLGVWTGNNDGHPMAEGATGLVGAAPIWHDAMLAVNANKPIRDFPKPPGLVTATVTYPDGVRSTDLYLEGKVPDSFKGGAPAPSPTAKPGEKTKPAPQVQPYCPSSFNYAFPPTNTNADGWW
ncbi:membrane peptidoglycan carboxypeptidase [Thermosporothrix hazakensis]|jgi:penicillin-binding protein 1A|uniref:Membrane peptidoglycan carboxypeptidase n=1 Tax=Thermosporothrix hazakensis TaxID=644383 RepID=A0A326UBW3_THEHA|nr:transglycosylase domain-containing protein [Thermosporothrix hazakensis]PZW25675.1 membrane peptidoglycan carboxypeptidase [Thermosporothrix hazakensis]GCE48170.1 hypothetical protein KTH_30390 [Thermosporothrix hazakensis]